MQTYHLNQATINKPALESASIADQAASFFDHHHNNHHHHHHNQQQQHNLPLNSNTTTTMPTVNTTSNSPANQATINCQASMASFVARLMSLSAHELHSLHADHELMRHLTETQLLMESRLQQTKLTGMIQQQQLAIQQQQQQMQFQQQQQQHIQLANQQNSPNYQLTQQQPTLTNCNQMSQLQLDHYYAQALSLASQQYSAAAAAAVAVGSNSNSNINSSTNQNLLMAAHQTSQLQLALDLRTSPQVGYHHLHANLGSPAQRLYSSAGSYYGSSSASSSTSSAGSSPVEQVAQQGCQSRTQTQHNQAQPQQQQQQQQQQAQKRSVNPKKIKLAQYQKQISSGGAGNIKPGLAVLTPLPASNRVEPTPKRICTASRPTPTVSVNGGKKYKGEFDEPNPTEVEQRQRNLARPDTNYHGPSASQCACVLGSIFHNKSNAEMLAIIERWRRLPTEERIKTKWDVTDLPKDIPLSEIKKFEDLRRDASNGRADFGGASKRKPLGIRGTRQFLLILYCLWGHPGRDDPMQKEGYCPHCFAKIKKANEQSTLVRVVNHFNMKHRRGANPRLSPRRDTLASAAASPQAVSATANGELLSPPLRPSPISPIANQSIASPNNTDYDDDDDEEPNKQQQQLNNHTSSDRFASSTDSTLSSISTSTASSPVTSFSPSPPSTTTTTTDSSTKPICKPEPETSEKTPTSKFEQTSAQVAIKLEAKTH